MIRRLRDKGHPIRLFGESDAEAAKRLNILETQETETDGMRNDFKTAMDKSEQESLNEIMNSIDGERTEEEVNVKNESDEQDEETMLQEILVNNNLI